MSGKKSKKKSEKQPAQAPNVDGILTLLAVTHDFLPSVPGDGTDDEKARLVADILRSEMAAEVVAEFVRIAVSLLYLVVMSEALRPPPSSSSVN
jgi:hypothetical protein